MGGCLRTYPKEGPTKWDFRAAIVPYYYSMSSSNLQIRCDNTLTIVLIYNSDNICLTISMIILLSFCCVIHFAVYTLRMTERAENEDIMM